MFRAGSAHIGELIPEDADWDIVSKAIGMDLVDDEVFEERQTGTSVTDIPEMLWDLLPLDSRFSGPTMLEWPANTGSDLTSRHYLPPQSLWALEQPRLAAMRKRQTRKKIAIQELSGLTEVAVEDWPEDTMSARKGAKLLAEPHYHQDSDGDYHHITGQLNVAITNVLNEFQGKQCSPERIASATAKICHNLLISSSAPNLQTFNILLAGFKKWQKPQLLDDVIHALDLCKVRPNEITCVAILDHYADTQRPDPFSRFVARMRGAGDALMLANPNITLNEKGKSRLIRASDTKVFQKVYPTPMVFDSLMHGVLKFAGFERAMDIYHEMKEDGWGLDILGLSRFLDDCIQRADWQGGLLIWGEIASIRGRIKPKPLAKAYAQFLALCSVAGNPAAFNSVLNDVIRRGYDRKSMLKSARAFTNAARQKNTYLAPAWTADNLLIAVSEYMTDGATEADTAPLFEEVSTESTLEYEEPRKQDGRTEDVWAAWMEHEFGEPAMKDTTKAAEPNDPPRAEEK
ncbi:hypothetical protein N0V90_006556 [Kalmusia sp. IMI 367209]|nr:hypothetical protein N0V90_006556 [Kalmusia sp. IMI 367209]